MSRFLREPDAWTDEDGDFAFVDVTEQTDTADKARDWLAANAERLWAHHLVRDEISDLQRLYLDMDSTGVLPTSLGVERLIREGFCGACWRLDISCARQEIPDEEWEAEHRAQTERRYAIDRLRAVECRGPWWWRLRYRVSQALLKVGGHLEPDDVGSAMWRDEDGKYVIRTVRGHRL